MDDIYGDPPLPGGDETRFALVTLPTKELNGEQLKGLMKTFNLFRLNLLNLHRILCDGSFHVLAAGLYRTQIAAVEPVLERLNIGYKVIQQGEAESTGLATGLNPDFKY